MLLNKWEKAKDSVSFSTFKSELLNYLIFKEFFIIRF